jgi:hypothetical protein
MWLGLPPVLLLLLMMMATLRTLVRRLLELSQPAEEKIKGKEKEGE